MRSSLGVLTSVALTVALTLTLAVGLAPTRAFAETVDEPVAAPTTTTLTAPVRVALRRPATISATVVASDAPVTEGAVRFERQTPSGWTSLGDAAVDVRGTATKQVTFTSSPGSLRAVYTGTAAFGASTSTAAQVQGVPQSASAVLGAPRSVVDERPLDMTATVRTSDGPVPGASVSFQVLRSSAWRTMKVVRTDARGVARIRSRPRVTYRYRAVVAGAGWHTGARTATVTVKNLPPGRVVVLPRKAPRPKALPAQARASGKGANATTSRISDATWRSMTGRSWRKGCPVGRASLRLVRVNYWGFDGYRHRGEIVVHASIAGKTARAFSDLYRNRVPIRSMYRVDRFGYSQRVRGADDHASMRADNTSGFNCRSVVGRPGIRSPHAHGRAIDINPFENPYRYAWGKWAPNSWWRNKAAGTYAWTERSHLVPTIMRRNGFRWTYGDIDAQHFDG